MNLIETLQQMDKAGKTHQEMLTCVLAHDPMNIELITDCTALYISESKQLPWVKQLMEAGVSNDLICSVIHNHCFRAGEWYYAAEHRKAFLNDQEAWEVFDQDRFLSMMIAIGKEDATAVFGVAKQIAFHCGGYREPGKKQRIMTLTRPGAMPELLWMVEQLEKQLVVDGKKDAIMVLSQVVMYLPYIDNEAVFNTVIGWLSPANQIVAARVVAPWGYGAVLQGYVLCCQFHKTRQDQEAIKDKILTGFYDNPQRVAELYRHLLYGASLAQYPLLLPTKEIRESAKFLGWAFCRLEMWEDPHCHRRDLQVEGWDRRGVVRIVLKQNKDDHFEGSSLREGDEVMIPPDPENGLTPFKSGRTQAGPWAIYFYNFIPATAQNPLRP
ncbi:MAG: hypothetical protein KBD15_02090 [Candidatus Magasanikbacteria bacterium]|jgi:hypothetical protein|nr:hypothetical protein [Candidatus Magasanikbacteria bacterium]